MTAWQDWSEDPETGKVEQQNELFAFRFANPENAAKFKEAFEKCQKGASDDMPVIKQDAEDAEKVKAVCWLKSCARRKKSGAGRSKNGGSKPMKIRLIVEEFAFCEVGRGGGGVVR